MTIKVNSLIWLWLTFKCSTKATFRKVPVFGQTTLCQFTVSTTQLQSINTLGPNKNLIGHMSSNARQRIQKIIKLVKEIY